MDVTVYIPCHNYAGFVGAAIDSVLGQVVGGWELIVVDDGSDDDSWEAISPYAGDPRVQIVRHESPLGLRRTANECLARASGDWLLRLDADDRLHPHCLDILLRAANEHPEADLVFPDYYYIDADDEILAVECLPSAADGYDARTFPPHGACSLVRREALEAVGGYDEDVARQDGHELWLKLLRAGRSYHHVPLPLFYYRRHGSSLSTDTSALLDDRRRIYRRLAEADARGERIVAVVPVKNSYPTMPDIPFRTVNGRTLIDLAIAEAAAVEGIEEIVVTTDDDHVLAYVADRFPGVVGLRRPPRASRPDSAMIDVVRAVVADRDYDPDVVICLLSVHTPRRTRAHIQKALDTFFLYDVDSVVAVYRERGLAYQMGERGLSPLNPTTEDRVHLERDVLYVDSNAVRVFRAANVQRGRLLGERIGHTLLTPEDAAQISSPLDFHLLDPLEDSGGQHVPRAADAFSA